MSLYAKYEQSNIFQRILSGTMPCAKVFEDDQVLSFMDVFPQAKGHTLVIPKTPACNLFDISEDTLKALVSRTQIIGRAVRDALDPDGIQIMQFNGDAAGQTVFHIHFHIIPRWYDMTLKSHAKGIMADMSDLKDTAARIAAKIKI